MLKPQRHKKFLGAMLNDRQLSPRCYWYVQLAGVIASVGNENDSWYKRPWYIQM